MCIDIPFSGSLIYYLYELCPIRNCDFNHESELIENNRESDKTGSTSVLHRFDDNLRRCNTCLVISVCRMSGKSLSEERLQQLKRYLTEQRESLKLNSSLKGERSGETSQ